MTGNAQADIRIWSIVCVLHIAQCIRDDFCKHIIGLGCGFPKYAREQCVDRDIRGWIKNTKKGTIAGKMQGQKQHIDEL